MICRTLVGIVVAPLCWKANEWVGLTVACSMDAVMQALQQFTDLSNGSKLMRPSELVKGMIYNH